MTSAGGGGGGSVSGGGSGDGNDVVFSLGIVADIQHSSTDVLLNDEHERTKYWDTLARLTAARRDWQSRGVDGLAQLGDLIDGNANEAASVEDCARVMSALFDSVAPPANDDDADDTADAGGDDDDGARPFLHVVGNHCLRHLSRRALRRVHRSTGVWEGVSASEGGGGTTRFRGVGGPTAHRAYYARTFARLPDVVFVVLDTTEMSLMERDTEGGWADGDYGHVQATRYLAERPLGSSIEMEEYNGGVTPAQLGFLRETLQACVDDGKRAVVLAHHPMLPTWECSGEGATIESIMDPHLCWNHAAVRQVLTGHREKGTGVPVCRAVLTGHCHWGGNGFADGIAFVTMKSMMFNPNGSAYGVLEFTRGGGIRLDGCGTLQDDVVISGP